MSELTPKYVLVDLFGSGDSRQRSSTPNTRRKSSSRGLEIAASRSSRPRGAGHEALAPIDPKATEALTAQRRPSGI
jgi:hypothetical protein